MDYLTIDAPYGVGASEVSSKPHFDKVKQLEQELDQTKKELLNVDMKLMSRGALLKDLYKTIDTIRNLKDIEEIKKSLYKLKSTLDFKLDEERCWSSFQNHFDLIQSDFYQKMKATYTNLSVTDLELCAFARMEMCNKEIANQLNISVRGVETRRYRLKKKLALTKSQSLMDILGNI